MADGTPRTEVVRPALQAKVAVRAARVVEERWAPQIAPFQIEGTEVLVYQPDPGARQPLIDALRLDGYETIDALHGLEALAITWRRRPALVVVTADMRRLSGASFVAEVRARPELDDVRIVVIDPAAPKDTTHEASRVDVWRAAPSSIGQARVAVDQAIARGATKAHAGRVESEVASANILFEAGRRLDERGRTAEAWGAYRYASELAPSVRRYAAWAAWAGYRLDPERAGESSLALLTRICETDASLVDVIVLRAKLLYAMGRPADARGVLFEAQSRMPRNAELQAALRNTALVQSEVLTTQPSSIARSIKRAWMPALSRLRSFG